MLRREMVFVNGTGLTQQLTGPLTTAGTFYVVDGSTITIWPPSGTDMSTATVDVATRSNLLRAPNGIVNLVLRGVDFQYDNNPVNGPGNGAVTISGQNLLVDQCQFNHNNFVGLNLVTGQNATVQQSSSEFNGENGFSMWEVSNLLFSGNEASYDNWRGFAAGFTGWDAAGAKLSRVHDATVANYTAIANQTGGLWFDTDNENVLVENGLFARNLIRGLFVENSQGPFTIQNNTFCNNQQYGLVGSNSTTVSASGNIIFGNQKQGLFFGGTDSPVSVTNYETKATYSLSLQDWSLQKNTISQSKSTQNVLDTGLSSSWSLFTSTLNSNYNNWYVPGSTNLFSVPSGVESLPSWQSSTGQDANSTSVSSAVGLPVACSTATSTPVASTTPAATPSATVSASATPTATSTATATRTPTATVTSTPTASASPSPTISPTKTATATGTFTATATATTTKTATPTATATPVAAPTPALITLRGYTSSKADKVTSITLAKPVTAVAGDVLVAQVAAYSSSVSILAGAPKGWTQAISKSSPNGREREWIFFHVVGQTEPSNYKFVFNKGGSVVVGAAGGIADYYNVNTTTPIDVSNGQFNASSTTIKATSMTSTATNDRLLCFMTTFAGVSPGNWTNLPSGMNTDYIAESSGQNIDAAFFDQALSAVGTISSKTASISPAADNIGILVALRPHG